MSKSLGNLYTLDDLAAKGYSAAEVRYVLIGAHYRQPLNFTFHSLDAARHALEKLSKAERALRQAAGSPPDPTHASLIGCSPGPFAEAWSHLTDDLNIPGALGSLFGTVNKSKPAQLDADSALQMWTGLHFILDALGLKLPQIDEENPLEIPPEITALAERRWQAKQSRDWNAADELRRQLDELGWVVKDTKDSYQVSPK